MNSQPNTMLSSTTATATTMDIPTSEPINED